VKHNYLKTRQVGATLWMEIHNPYVNFLTVDILEELWDVVKTARKDDSVRVLVLTGALRIPTSCISPSPSCCA